MKTTEKNYLIINEGIKHCITPKIKKNSAPGFKDVQIGGKLDPIIFSFW